MNLEITTTQIEEFEREVQSRTGCTFSELGFVEEDYGLWISPGDTVTDCVTTLVVKYGLDDLGDNHTGTQTNDARTKREGGIHYWPPDWTMQCEARCRKTGERCPHTCDCMIPTTISSGGPGMDAQWYQVLGKPVSLCRGHWFSWNSRSKRLLTIPLIHGGHLSPANRHGYGAIVITTDRIDFGQERPRVKVPAAWGWISWRGNIPEGLLERLPKLNLNQSES